MAYFLFKYIRRGYRERKNATADESHLIVAVDGQGNGRGESLSSQTARTSAHPLFSDNSEENARIATEASRRRRNRWKMILGLVLPNFLAAVDVTIVAPAIPVISSHFNRLNGSFNWIVAAYTLTFTTFVPASGQLAEIYGRHFALQFQMFWILAGSVLCASAVTWGMLLFGRALQGLGAAGIMNLTHIVLSDGVSLADNSKSNTLFSLISGISYAVGPVIGGYLTNSSWRYCFVVPIPIACVSHILIFFSMRKELVKGRVSAKPGDSRRTGYVSGLFTFDWIGIILFISGVGLLILGIQWGGTSYSWSSAAVIAPCVIGGVLFVAFFAHEYFLGPGRVTARLFPNQVPMFPSTLFRKKDTSMLMIINFTAGMALVSAFYFISYYWQIAEGYSASRAGIQLLYYTPGIGIGVYSAMFMCNIWPRQTFFPLLWGSILETVGLALLTWAVCTRQRTLVNVFLAVSGAGTGLRFMPVVLHAAGIWPSRIAAIQSLMSFTVPFGETIGISMMGAVFSNKLDTYLRVLSTQHGASLASSVPTNFESLNSLPPAVKDAVQDAAAKAVMWAFVSIMPFMGLSVVAAILLGNVWIGKEAKAGKNEEQAREEVKGMVLDRAYLWAVATGCVRSGRREIAIPGVEGEKHVMSDVEVRATPEGHGSSLA
ncbi:hypothetical protein BDV95DRAFT_497358 [Massariosphaeria phaeospora]|uniref:Major facilitator superfamily (MFS) profile domain-containing protein n=1 Tax=Massariosphaeria phaeospora TaxID=100035 RepID=A0A7C8ML68_9PLEO|nr:hypothetical protein BDV95DRAFT_497358 [Massariosphaeria phaeospora]